MRVEASGYAE
jgi:hypothetical protein